MSATRDRLLRELESGGAGGGGTGATAQNQLDQINKLEALSNTVATKVDQDEIDALLTQINTTTESLRSQLLAENATEAKQDAMIAKNEELRVLLVDLKARLGDPDVDTNLPSQRSLLKSLLDKQNSVLTWTASANSTVTTTSDNILPADPDREVIRICNLSPTDERIYINFGADAHLTSAVYVIQQDQTLELDSAKDPIKERISAIASAGTINITYKVAT